MPVADDDAADVGRHCSSTADDEKARISLRAMSSSVDFRVSSDVDGVLKNTIVPVQEMTKGEKKNRYSCFNALLCR